MGGRIRFAKGFTVVELLVVIAIIGTMVALLLPAVQYARESARRATCANNLKNIGYAFQQHNTQWEIFPNAGSTNFPLALARSKAANGTPRPAKLQDWGWGYQILPYLEQRPLYNNPNDSIVAAAVIRTYFCPSRRKPEALGTSTPQAATVRGQIDYAGNGGSGQQNGSEFTQILHPQAGNEVNANGTVIPRIDRDRVALGNIKDGASATLLVGERCYNPKRPRNQLDEDSGYVAPYTWDTIRWGYNVPMPDYKRTDPPAFSRDFGSSHSAGCQFVYADGAVKMINYQVNLPVFQAISGRNDGKSLSVP